MNETIAEEQLVACVLPAGVAVVSAVHAEVMYCVTA
jgi:hypothetical protein